MLEDRTIEVWAYNLETVLAEKLETVISRNVTNTRMRDFYDIYILQKLHGEQLKKQVLWTALSDKLKLIFFELFVNRNYKQWYGCKT